VCGNCAIKIIYHERYKDKKNPSVADDAIGQQAVFNEGTKK
jgi:hypothetical protein